MLFRTFGYEYALSPEVEPVLKVLHGETDADELRPAPIVVHPGRDDEALTLPNTLLLAKPDEFRCFAVMLRDPEDQRRVRMVPMPGFGQQGKDCYARILASDGKWGPFQAQTIVCPAFERFADTKYKWWAHWLWENE